MTRADWAWTILLAIATTFLIILAMWLNLGTR